MGARPSSFKVDVAPAPSVPTVQWSPEQEAVFTWFEYAGLSDKFDQPEGTHTNLVVRARAGTGKTTTIIEGVDRAPESRILLAAFNKGIAQELSQRLRNPSAEAKTLHALGYMLIQRQWRKMPVAEGSARAEWLTNEVLKDWERDHKEKVPFQIKRLITNLHTKVREMLPLDPTPDQVLNLAYRFDFVPDENWPMPFNDDEFVVGFALAAVHYAAENPPRWDVGIDYADMLFLPLVWNLTSRDYDLVVVDEAQDMTMAQLELAQRVCSGRICIVGDDRQAIYGFRGADSGSIDRLKMELNAVELPLNTTYRCGKTIVELAQTLVPDIVAHENNGQGVIDYATVEELYTQVRPGDFVLSRLNAPLVAITLRLLRQGVRARMAGRDIGAGINAILRKLKVENWTPLEQTVDRIRTWESKTVTRLAARGQQDLIARTRDQAEMLYALCEDAEATGDVLQKLQWLFEEKSGDDVVVCSSVHKAKGLERVHVFVLMDTFYRRGRNQEEENLHYVAVTRAKQHLTLISA